MKKYLALLMVGFMIFVLVGCGDSNGPLSQTAKDNVSVQTENSDYNLEEEDASQATTDMEMPESSDRKILVAYFSRVGNTDFPEGIDAVSSASLNLQDGNLMGNTEVVASMLQQETGGDLFLIETEKTYPADYDKLVDYGQEEPEEDSRPALSSHVENMDDYDVVFLGYPNWWFDMPMAVYSFLDEYDFSGKTIIPFCTHGGSRFSNTIAELKEYLPEANVLDGFEVYGENAAESQNDIQTWIESIGMLAGSGEKSETTEIALIFGDTVITAELDNSETSQAFVATLPRTITMSRYDNREYYGRIDAITENGEGIADFENGDVTYYPAGPSFAVFFGKAGESSQSGLIRMGKITSDLSVFATLGETAEVRIEVIE